MQFTVKTIKNTDIESKLDEIGFDKTYLLQAVKKHSFLSLEVQNLPPHCATIIKETALSKGCDAGVHREVLMRNIESSSLILSGTIKQLEDVSKSLLNQPFGLSTVAARITEEIALSKIKKQPEIFGILNITEDSFSDGGLYLDEKQAIKHGLSLIEDGAKIIDVGAESTRPGAALIDAEIEIMRLRPVVSELKKNGIKVSIDTRNSKTAREMLTLSADIINDVSGLTYDPRMGDALADCSCDVVIMHSKGTPDTMDTQNNYNNLIADIYSDLEEKINNAQACGIKKERIIIDVGFGFAKNIEQNFELLKRIQEFNSLGVRQLAGASRKRFLKSLVSSCDNEILDEVTMLSSFYLAMNNVDYIRVHNPKKTTLALEFYNSIC